ncbi:MAG TPA: DUF4232 domain-containing protein [Jatrophihabitans sp.]|jgi:hypothetical protein
MSSRIAWVAVAAVAIGSVAVFNSYRASHQDSHPAITMLPALVDPLPIHAGNCGDWPGMSIEQEASIPVSSTAHPKRVVLSFRCTDANGGRRPSVVLIADYDGQAAESVFEHFLIDEHESLHTDHITVTGATITVTASYWGGTANTYAPAAKRQGYVIEKSFTVPDNGAPVPGPNRLVAWSCGRQDLALSLAAGPGKAGGSWLLRFRNTARTRCAIEGYPSVQPRDGLALVSKAYQTPSGRLGGLLSGEMPPVVVVQPGQSASALLEPSAEGQDAQGGGCTIDRLEVSLPAAGPIGELVRPLSWCSPEIHPVVAGETGSG